MKLELTISGEPKPQPRPRARALPLSVKGVPVFKNGQRVWTAQIYNPSDCDGWKRMIECAVKPHLPSEPIDCPVAVTATFFFERPDSHYGTGRNAGLLKPSAPTKHTQRPDFDNLVKAVLDALTDAGLWRDDALIADAHIAKRWANQHPGVMLVIEWPDEVQAPLPLAAGAAA